MADILVFGGAFDPIHLGHVFMAEAARDRLAQVEGKHYEI